MPPADGLKCWKVQQICSRQKKGKPGEETGGEQRSNLHIRAVCEVFWDLVKS